MNSALPLDQEVVLRYSICVEHGKLTGADTNGKENDGISY